jgi:hypothetical protein
MVVSGGYVIGSTTWATNCSKIVSLACLVGVILALIALFHPSRAENGFMLERIAACGLVAYVVLATVTEQFAWVWRGRDVLLAVVWLLPLIVGGVGLPRRGCWLVGVGFWAVLFGSVAALTYSATHDASGVGLFGAWLT